jgi:hypothetical protein
MLTCSRFNFRVSREKTLRYGFASIGRALKVEKYYTIVEKFDQLYKERLVVVVVVVKK